MRKNTCSKCDGLVEESRKGQRYCKKCHAENMRINRPKHSQLSDVEKKKANCRAYLKVYVRRGKVIKEPCSICGDKNSEGHHPDYSQPLLVVWLCRAHHLELHSKV